MRKVIEDSLTEEMMEINKDTMQKIKQILEDRLALDIDVKLDVSFRRNILLKVFRFHENILTTTLFCSSFSKFNSSVGASDYNSTTSNISEQFRGGNQLGLPLHKV
jgi:hypothetical protein